MLALERTTSAFANLFKKTRRGDWIWILLRVNWLIWYCWRLSAYMQRRLWVWATRWRDDWYYLIKQMYIGRRVIGREFLELLWMCLCKVLDSSGQCPFSLGWIWAEQQSRVCSISFTFIHSALYLSKLFGRGGVVDENGKVVFKHQEFVFVLFPRL